MEPIINHFRFKRGDQGTRGMWITNGIVCNTLELPWRDNEPNISCIPAGEYKVRMRISGKYGEVYHIKDVPNRSYILIHSGNWAGDIKKGFKTHVKGCILLGKSRGLLQGQWAVLNSRITVRKFMLLMQKQPFTLKIHELF